MRDVNPYESPGQASPPMDASAIEDLDPLHMPWTALALCCGVCCLLGFLSLITGMVALFAGVRDPAVTVAIGIGGFHFAVNGIGLIGVGDIRRRRKRWRVVAALVVALANGLAAPFAAIALLRLRNKDEWDSFQS